MIRTLCHMWPRTPNTHNLKVTAHRYTITAKKKTEGLLNSHPHCVILLQVTGETLQRERTVIHALLFALVPNFVRR